MGPCVRRDDSSWPGRRSLPIPPAISSPKRRVAFANARKPGATKTLSVSDHPGHAKTAFVFAGGGSFGAIQVGMMHSLAAHGISADMVVGSSVGALNGAFYAGDPSLQGVLRLETIWRGLAPARCFSGDVADDAGIPLAPGFPDPA